MQRRQEQTKPLNIPSDNQIAQSTVASNISEVTKRDGVSTPSSLPPQTERQEKGVDLLPKSNTDPGLRGRERKGLGVVEPTGMQRAASASTVAVADNEDDSLGWWGRLLRRNRVTARGSRREGVV